MPVKLSKEEVELQAPPGLTKLLNEFTSAVLVSRPDNLLRYAKDYFDEKYSYTYAEDDMGNISALPTGYKNFQRRKSIASERYEPEKDDESAADNVVYPKSPAQMRKLSASVHTIFIFKSLEPDQVVQVIGAMQERSVMLGEVIIKEGDEEADFFYVVDKGRYEITIGGQVVHTYVDEGSFGELALLYNTPRAATITALAEGVLWALDRKTFRRIVLKAAYTKRMLYEEFINTVPILSSLDPYERMTVCDALKPMKFENETVIIRAGDKANSMYFVEQGSVRVMRANEAGEIREVSRITRGGYFGELGLISKKPRAADVIAAEKTTCAELDLEAFERLLGPCLQLMKRNLTSYDDDMKNAFNETST